MIERLRPLPDLAATYPVAHDSGLYGRGHQIRVDLTIAYAVAWNPDRWDGVLDLSAGDARIPRAVTRPGSAPVLGDYAPTPGYTHSGRLEDVLPTIDPGWALYVCSETLEHLDDPGAVLNEIRGIAREILVTTPIMGPAGDTNPEHVWSWDRDGVEELLHGAGWHVDVFAALDTRPFGDPYQYGLWIAS